MANHAERSGRIDKIAQTLHDLQDRAERNPKIQAEVNNILAMIENVIGPIYLLQEMKIGV